MTRRRYLVIDSLDLEVVLAMGWKLECVCLGKDIRKFMILFRHSR
jgi:hypothetical protein